MGFWVLSSKGQSRGWGCGPRLRAAFAVGERVSLRDFLDKRGLLISSSTQRTTPWVAQRKLVLSGTVMSSRGIGSRGDRGKLRLGKVPPAIRPQAWPALCFAQRRGG